MEKNKVKKETCSVCGNQTYHAGWECIQDLGNWVLFCDNIKCQIKAAELKEEIKNRKNKPKKRRR